VTSHVRRTILQISVITTVVAAWSTNCTLFSKQLNYESEVECVSPNMLQTWAKLLNDNLSLSEETVSATPEVIPAPPPIPPVAAVGVPPRNLVTLGNPGGDTKNTAEKRVALVSQNVESGMICRVFSRGTIKSSDWKLSKVIRKWRVLIRQQPLRMEPPEWTSKTGEAGHNKFDWVTEFSQKPSFDSNEILGKLGLHHCLHF